MGSNPTPGTARCGQSTSASIYSESQVLECRESESRPHGGIVMIRTRGLNQDGEQVVAWKRTFFVYRRGAEAAEVPFPEARTPW